MFAEVIHPQHTLRMRKTGLLALIFFAVPVWLSAQKNPDPRRAELMSALKAASPVAEAVHGDEKQFIQLALPFAPLNLTIESGDMKLNSDFNNIFFGYEGEAAGIADDEVPALANRFHCGPPCAERRGNAFVPDLTALRKLVQQFQLNAPGVQVLAQWGVEGSFRFNNVFVNSDRSALAYTPSPLVHAVPSNMVQKYPNFMEALPAGVSGVRLLALVAEAKDLRICAIQDTPTGIRLIREGNADNVSGVLILKKGKSAPQVGDDFQNGWEIVWIKEIAPEIYYFETS